MKNNKASILVISLWILFLLAGFALVLNAYIKPNMQVINKVMQRTKAYYLAQAAFKRAVFELSLDKTNLYDGLNESWYSNEKGFKQVKSDDGIYEVYSKLKDKEIRYGLTDEESKINIALVTPNILNNLFEIIGGLTNEQAKELTKDVVEYRKDRGFYFLSEVLLVKNFDKELYEKIKDKITIFGDGKVNINTASKDVLKCFGVNDILAEKIIVYRKGLDGKEGTEDDAVFPSESLVIDLLNNRENLFLEEVSVLTRIIGAQVFCVYSNNFSGWARASVQKEIVNIYFVADRTKKIKSWRVYYKDEVL